MDYEHGFSLDLAKASVATAGIGGTTATLDQWMLLIAFGSVALAAILLRFGFRRGKEAFEA